MSDIGSIQRDLTTPHTTDLGNFSKTVRFARIVDVYDASILTSNASGEKDKYGKVSIVFLDSPGTVPTLIPFLSTWHSWSRGSGIMCMPEQNDIVACLEQSGGFPVVIGFLPYKWNESTKSIYSTSTNPVGNTRPLYKGEICIKSSSGGNVLLDKNGTVTISGVDPSMQDSVILGIEGNCTEQSFNRTIPNTKAVINKTVIGKSYLIDGTAKYVGNFPQIFESGMAEVAEQSVTFDYSSQIEFILAPDTEIADIISVNIYSVENNVPKVYSLSEGQYTIQCTNIYTPGEPSPLNADYKPATVERNSYCYTLITNDIGYTNAKLTITYNLRKFSGGVRVNSAGDLFLDGRNVIVRANNEVSSLSLSNTGTAELRGIVSTTLGNTYSGSLTCDNSSVSYCNGLMDDGGKINKKTLDETLSVTDNGVSYFYLSDALPLIKMYKQDKVWKFDGVSEEEYSSLSGSEKSSIKKIWPSAITKLFTEDRLAEIMQNKLLSYSELKRK